MNPAVLEALAQGATVVTSTNRLSYEIKASYDALQIQQGLSAWPTANVITWNSWLNDLWQRHSARTFSPLTCLNNQQVEQLIIDIIAADLKTFDQKNQQHTAALWNTAATAKTALDAWELCHQWFISYAALKDSPHADHARFGAWANALHAKLRKHDWISPIQISSILIKDAAPEINRTLLFGFDHFDAQQQAFITHLSAQQNFQHIPAPQATPNTNNIARYVFADTQDEWQHIGAWARGKLEQNPSLKIGIITPNIRQIKALASQALREQLCPDYFLEARPEPFHFSQGQALVDVPLIKSAFECLDLLGQIEFKQLTPTLLSPYWGSADEQSFRAQLQIDLHTKIAYRFDVYELIRATDSDPDNPLRQAFIDKLQAVQTLKKMHQGQHPLGHWREVFNQCLDALTWPISALDSADYQAHKAWISTLSDWVGLDKVCQPMSLTHALQSLKRHCQQSQFQAQALDNAPVQIMGVLEASELEFDAVWLAGFSEAEWPVRPHANPFIPIQIQCDKGIPDASIHIQAEHASIKTQQLLALCDETHISHGQLEGDIQRAISPLLADIPIAKNILPQPFNLYQRIRAATPELNHQADDIGLPMIVTTSEDNNEHTGGTGIIKSQAACPFQAYAKHRLIIRETNIPEAGTDNLTRGNFLHEVLASFWDETKTSQYLHELIIQNQLESRIAKHVDRYLQKRTQLSGLEDGFKQAEAKRLNALMLEWLQLEAKRPAFQVEASEQVMEYTLNGLKLSFQLDRVDQLLARDGETRTAISRMVMDYKSGECNIKHWATERPAEPQIPLYFLALEAQSAQSVDALAFGQVKTHECAFVGSTRLADILPEVKHLDKLDRRGQFKKDFEHWADLMPIWKQRLGALAEEIKLGGAHVDPKNSQSCEYCDFTPLCRIHTRDRIDDEEEQDYDAD